MTIGLARRRPICRCGSLARPALAAACLLALAGCAYDWRKPHVGDAAADSALAACDLVAQRNAAAVAPHPPPGPMRLPSPVNDLSNPAWSVPQELLVQQSLRNQCMRERGYRLEAQTQPVP